ncbi:hypothetical protein AB0J72_52495 [Dactylosporangium sp. NPDC049742]|uniref:hypothetical protein n=1 Tax=Dactylosporangium sp. NPDC049742 TaxID=3154737 RepID=UPI003437D1CA
MADRLKSEAVILYTSRGRSPFPRADLEAVRMMPTPAAAALARFVEALAMEVSAAFPLDWRGEHDDLDVPQAMRAIEAAVLGRHPDLSPEAAAALAWKWSYSAVR